MRNIRVIPVLLLHKTGLVKTVKFRDPKYVGDAINALKIFNEKEVDEIILLDILATKDGRGPNLKFLAQAASECFMPLCYGGGVNSLEEAGSLFALGVEKIALNTALHSNPTLLTSISDRFGRQSVVASIDYKRSLFGRPTVYTHGGSKNTGIDPIEYAMQVVQNGAGEVLLNSIDRDGTMTGYDIDILKQVSSAVSVPVVACGGVGSIEHLVDGVKSGGASAVAAGSFFVFHGKHRAVLINVPPYNELLRAFSS